MTISTVTRTRAWAGWWDLGVLIECFNVRHAVATWNERDKNGTHTVAACGCGWTQRADRVADLLGASGDTAADALLVAMGLHMMGAS